MLESQNNPAKSWALINELPGNPSKRLQGNALTAFFGPDPLATAHAFYNAFAIFSGKARENDSSGSHLPKSNRVSEFRPQMALSDLGTLTFSLKPNRSPG